VKHFIYRALCEGQDNTKKKRRKPLGALRRFGGNIFRSSFKIATRHREVGLNWAGALGAMFIAFGYYGLTFCGELVSAVFPHLIRRNLRV
jgi:hypothetical protein